MIFFSGLAIVIAAPVTLLSGLVGLDDSIKVSLRSNKVSRKADCGELGMDDGASEDIVFSDCIDQKSIEGRDAAGGPITDVCDRFEAAAEEGVQLPDQDVED